MTGLKDSIEIIFHSVFIDQKESLTRKIPTGKLMWLSYLFINMQQ